MAIAATPSLSIATVGTDTLSDRVYDRLARALMTGEIRPGATITLKDAARLVGTSVMPVRETVRRLMTQHALILERNKAIRIPLLTSVEFEQLWHLRELLEGEACAQAATVISDEELASLSQLLTQTLSAAKAHEMRHLIISAHEFFFRTYRASRNAVLVSMIEMLWLRTGPLYYEIAASVSHLSFIRKNLKNNARLFDALRARDPDAARETRRRDLRELANWFRDHLWDAQSNRKLSAGSAVAPEARGLRRRKPG